MPDESHVEVKSISYLVNLLSKQNPTYLEILCTPYKIVNNTSYELIMQNYKHDFLTTTSGMIHTLIGTILNEASQTYKKRPGNEDVFNKTGVDCKALSHIYRLDYILENLLKGEYMQNLYIPPENIKKKIMAVKRGEYIPPKEEVEFYKEKVMKIKNNIPFAKLDHEFVENFQKDINILVKKEIVKEVKKEIQKEQETQETEKNMPFSASTFISLIE